MRKSAIAAAVIAATVDVLYVEVVIPAQHAEDPAFLTVPFVAAFIALMTICALGSAALPSRASVERWRPLLSGAAASGLLLIGFFALMSIGLPLFVAGLVLLISLVANLSSGGATDRRRALTRIGMAVGGGALSIALLLGGFSLAEVMIRCPANGQMSGGGITVVGTSYSYSCDNGRLSVTR